MKEERTIIIKENENANDSRGVWLKRTVDRKFTGNKI